MSTAKKEMPAGAALSPYDTAEFLRTPEEIASYLEVVFEEYGDDPRMIAKALGNAARAQGMQKIAKETGISREGLYQALSGKSNPGFDTVLKVLNAVGVELHPKALPRKRRITSAQKQLSRKVVRDRATGEDVPAGRVRHVRKQA